MLISNAVCVYLHDDSTVQRPRSDGTSTTASNIRTCSVSLSRFLGTKNEKTSHTEVVKHSSLSMICREAVWITTCFLECRGDAFSRRD